MSAKVWKRASDNLMLHEPSGTYYVRKFRAGKGRLFKSTGENRKGQAQSIANTMMAEWLHGKNPLHASSLVRDVCDKLALALEKDIEDGRRSPKTGEQDRLYIRLIKEHFGHLYVNEIDEAFWEQWVRTRGRKLGRTLGDISKYLSKTLTFAHGQKLIDRKPRIKNPDERSDEVRTYTKAEVRTLIQVAKGEIRDLIILGAECGMRPYESRRLRWDMVRLGKSTTIELPAWFTKTRSRREFYVGPMSAGVLRRRARDQRSAFVFPSSKEPVKKPINEVTFSKRWRKVVKAAGLPEGSKFHWLRHTFFSQALLESGKALPKVAAYGGNSPKILFDRYLSKEASRTQDVAGSVSWDEEE